MKLFLFMVLIMFLVIGCATLHRTVDEIKSDVPAFQSDASQYSSAFMTLLPPSAAIGAGYLIAFLRRLYKNYKIEKATKKQVTV